MLNLTPGNASCVQGLRYTACGNGSMAAMRLQAESEGGYVKLADVKAFPVSTEMSGALVKLVKGGGMRQLHW